MGNTTLRRVCIFVGLWCLYFQTLNTIVASCFLQLCLQVRVHGESRIRYWGSSRAATSWKVIKGANEGQLPLGCEQTILGVSLIQISDSGTL